MSPADEARSIAILDVLVQAVADHEGALGRCDVQALPARAIWPARVLLTFPDDTIISITIEVKAAQVPPMQGRGE